MTCSCRGSSVLGVWGGHGPSIRWRMAAVGESGDPGDFGRDRPAGVLAPSARLVVVDVR